MREVKDSGNSWIGEIPKDWKIVHLKYLCSFKTGGTPRGKSGIDIEGPYMWVTPSDIDESFVIKKTAQYISFEAVRNSGYNLYPSCSVLLVCIASVGKVGIIQGKAYSNQQITALKPYTNIILPKYLLYNIVAASKQISFDASSNVVPIINTRYLENFNICKPSYIAQKEIASFLDSKCAEIDALTADIQSEIETLEEYKRSRIFETVEHGFGHKVFVDTDSDVWQTIPEGWKLVDIKYLFEIVKRIAGKEGYDIIAITQQGLKYKDVSSNEGQLASDYSGYQFLYPGDFAMNHMDLLTGWVDLSDKFGVTSPDYRVFRLRYPDKFDRKYYKHVMQSCYMCRIFYSFGRGVSNLGRWRLQTSTFNDFKVPVPPYEEQIIIGQYLDEKVSGIDSIITQKQEQLTVLANYKKSLIYEYVTGKKEVPVA